VGSVRAAARRRDGRRPRSLQSFGNPEQEMENDVAVFAVQTRNHPPRAMNLE
jgi:hypothetical protein